MTGLMTTTACFRPIGARFVPQSVFVNDVSSVKQDGAVLSVNRCELVYRRSSRPRLKRQCCFTLIWGEYLFSSREVCCRFCWTRRNNLRASGELRRGERLTAGMDGGEYMETMDPTLAELGDEFTLGDIDGE